MPTNVEIVPMKNENNVPGRRSIWIIIQRSTLFLKKMSKIIKRDWTWAITMIISISDNEYIQKFLTKELFKIILSSQFIHKFNFRFQSHVFSSIDIFAVWTIWVELFFECLNYLLTSVYCVEFFTTKLALNGKNVEKVTFCVSAEFFGGFLILFKKIDIGLSCEGLLRL